jgi:hypothetical protein
MTRKNGRTPSDPRDTSDTAGSDDGYRVGPGHPPKEFQFKRPKRQPPGRQTESIIACDGSQGGVRTRAP